MSFDPSSNYDNPPPAKIPERLEPAFDMTQSVRDMARAASKATPEGDEAAIRLANHMEFLRLHDPAGHAKALEEIRRRNETVEINRQHRKKVATKRKVVRGKQYDADLPRDENGNIIPATNPDVDTETGLPVDPRKSKYVKQTNGDRWDHRDHL